MNSRRMISNVTRGVERTIDNLPVVNIFKRVLDRYTPLQVNDFERRRKKRKRSELKTFDSFSLSLFSQLTSL